MTQPVDDLTEPVRNVVVAKLRRSNVSVAVIDDAIQEAFVRYLIHKPFIESESHFAAWLVTTAHHWAVDDARHQRRITLDSEFLDDLGNESLGWSAEPSADFKIIFDGALDRLSEADRSILELIASGESLTDYASNLNISKSAAAKRLQRARDAFRKLLIEEDLGYLIDGKRIFRRNGR